MNDLLLYLATAAIPAICLIWLAHHYYRKRNPLLISSTEWRERMRELDRVMPIKPPKPSRFKGAAGICYAEAKPRTSRPTLVKKRTGTK